MEKNELKSRDNALDVYAIGDANWDVLVFLDNFPDEDKQIVSRFYWVPGGEAQNTARKLWELGARVKLVARIGRDELGQHLAKISPFAEFTLDGKKTGTTFAFVFKDGTRSFVTDRGANENLDWSQVDRSDIESSNFVFKGGYWHNLAFRENKYDIKLFKLAKDLGKPTGLNLGWNYTGWDDNKRESLFKLFEYTDYLFLNRDEAEDITQETGRKALNTLAEYTNVVLHNGEECCIFKSKSVEAAFPGEPVYPRNPVGAGDAFNAGFILGLLKTNDIGHACKLGNKIAAEHVSEQPTNYISKSI